MLIAYFVLENVRKSSIIACLERSQIKVENVLQFKTAFLKWDNHFLISLLLKIFNTKIFWKTKQPTGSAVSVLLACSKRRWLGAAALSFALALSICIFEPITVSNGFSQKLCFSPNAIFGGSDKMCKINKSCTFKIIITISSHLILITFGMCWMIRKLLSTMPSWGRLSLILILVASIQLRQWTDLKLTFC